MPLKPMKVSITFIGFFLSFSCGGQDIPLSQKMSQTAMSRWPTGTPGSWNYEQGLVQRAIQTVWERTSNVAYYNYIKSKTDYFVTNAGNINTYNANSYNLDNIATGRSLHFLYKQTGLSKYKWAADRLRGQLSSQPRTSDGGFWHKQIYPYQMWLDGLFMAEPFYAEYASLYEQNALIDVAKQFVLMEKHARDTSTGLLYHGWNETRTEAWADPVTGCSPNIWGRAMGWYAMALVDAIEFFPQTNPQRDTLLGIWKRLSTSIIDYQDSESSLWYQVMDKGDSSGNYLEASASCMFVYALAKAARLGYSDSIARMAALKGYQGILSSFVTTDLEGRVHLQGTCPVAGLGGTPYRDGSYAYYVSVKGVEDDAKGIGAFILAAVEMEGTSGTLGLEASEQVTATIKLYPNPVQKDLYVSLDNEEAWLELYDMQGQKIYSGRDNLIPMGHLAEGLYVLVINFSNQKRQFKVIKR